MLLRNTNRHSFCCIPFSFQGTRSEDVAVDPHMKDFFQSQNEDIDIQGKPNKSTQPQLLDLNLKQCRLGILLTSLCCLILGLVRIACLKSLFIRFQLITTANINITTLFLFCGKPLYKKQYDNRARNYRYPGCKFHKQRQNDRLRNSLFRIPFFA